MADVHLKIEIEEGAIEIEGIHGNIQKGCFTLYLSLREKHAAAEVVCENPGIVNIYGTEETTTPIGEDDEGIRHLTEEEQAEPTTLVLPEGWCIGVDLSKHTCRIIGVRDVDTKQLNPVPFAKVAR